MEDYNIKTEKNKKTKVFEIRLEGHLNVNNIANIKKDLTSTIKNNKNVLLSIGNSDDADITIVQLLIALKNKYNKKEVKIEIDLDLNNEISELFNRAGFANTIN